MTSKPTSPIRRKPSTLPPGNPSIKGLMMLAAVGSVACAGEEIDKQPKDESQIDSGLSAMPNEFDAEIRPPMIMPEQDGEFLPPMPAPDADMRLDASLASPTDDMMIEPDALPPMPPPEPDMEIVAPMPPPEPDLGLEADMRVVAPMPPPMPPPREDQENEP